MSTNFRDSCKNCNVGSPASPLPHGHPYRGSPRTPQVPPVRQSGMLGSSAYGARSRSTILDCPMLSPTSSTTGRASTRRLRYIAATIGRAERHPVAVRDHLRLGAWPPTPPPRRSRLLHAREHWRVGFEKGLRLPLASPEQAAAHSVYAARARHDREAARSVIRRHCRSGRRTNCTRSRNGFELSEIVINTWTFDPEARRHSYALLASKLRLRGSAAAHDHRSFGALAVAGTRIARR